MGNHPAHFSLIPEQILSDAIIRMSKLVDPQINHKSFPVTTQLMLKIWHYLPSKQSLTGNNENETLVPTCITLIRSQLNYKKTTRE